ncbi:fumarylacetoacetase [Granulicella arctica]
MVVTVTALEEYWTWKSWVASANEPECDFPLQNLPFCVLQMQDGESHLGVGIGDFIFDLHLAAGNGLLDALDSALRHACTAPYLNPLMQCGNGAVSQLRRAVMLLMTEGTDATQIKILEKLLIPREGAVLRKPVQVGNYTDFYASIDHATNVGRLFRPDQPLLPNYKFVPIGYHGRASSLILSGTPVSRPHGQTKPPSADLPTFGATKQLDYELEVGVYVGTGNSLGHSISIESAEEHIFGISLVNDWSARDIQAWEYQPLGPFLGKSFATSISPWVVTMDALAPFRVPLAPRPSGDPAPLPYLSSPAGAAAAIDLKLEVHLSTQAMRDSAQLPVQLSSGNLRSLYWSFAQMLAHHTSNGCNLLSGDLIASGTLSGPEEGSQGSLLEISHRGTTPFKLANGEIRSFLQDGDEVILRGFCELPGLPRIGLGECRGIIAPPIAHTHE